MKRRIAPSSASVEVLLEEKGEMTLLANSRESFSSST